MMEVAQAEINKLKAKAIIEELEATKREENKRAFTIKVNVMCDFK